MILGDADKDLTKLVAGFTLGVMAVEGGGAAARALSPSALLILSQPRKRFVLGLETAYVNTVLLRENFDVFVGAP